MIAMNYDDFAKKLAACNIDVVLERFKEETGAAEAQCSRAQDLYTKYLYLAKKYPDMMLVPPKLADELWHRHILFTQKYHECCEEVIGRFLHHTPDTSYDPIYQKAWQKTIELYREEFGDDLRLLEGAACGD